MIETLFKYSIAVSITLVIAWICYRMALGKDNRFKVDRAIVIIDADFSDGCNTAIIHELGHITHRHTLDLIIAQAVAIFCWYNPAAWLLRRMPGIDVEKSSLIIN